MLSSPLYSCSSYILVSLKDDKGTEIALHAVFRGVILWFPGESKLASCLLVSFLGFFGFLFLLLSFETCMLKAQPHRKPSLTKPQQQNYHTPPSPKPSQRSHSWAQFHCPKNFSALQWECTRWVGNPKVFHCLCLEKGQCSLGSYQFLLECWGRCFFRGEKRYCFYLHQNELQKGRSSCSGCVCSEEVTGRSCWGLIRVEKNSAAIWNSFEVPISCLLSSFSFPCPVAFCFY